MKKTVIGMALMAMALVGFNGMAQTAAQCPKAQVENQACCKQGDKKGMKKDARVKQNPYEGLTLTEAQKGKLAELDKKMEAKRQAKMVARKADGRKGDRKSMTDTERQAAMEAKMNARKAEKIEYLQEVKEIVGPDQYVVFLENFYVNGGAQKGGKAMMQGKDGRKGMAHGKAGKGDRKGQKGQKGQKGGQRGQKGAANAQS